MTHTSSPSKLTSLTLLLLSFQYSSSSLHLTPFNSFSISSLCPVSPHSLSLYLFFFPYVLPTLLFSSYYSALNFLSFHNIYLSLILSFSPLLISLFALHLHSIHLPALHLFTFILPIADIFSVSLFILQDDISSLAVLSLSHPFLLTSFALSFAASLLLTASSFALHFYHRSLYHHALALFLLQVLYFPLIFCVSVCADVNSRYVFEGENRI